LNDQCMCNASKEKKLRKGFICILVAALMITSGLLIFTSDESSGLGTEMNDVTSDITTPWVFDWPEPIIYLPYIPITYVLLSALEVRSTTISPFMYVFVNSSIYSSIADELAVYAEDVERTGLGCSIWTISDTADPDAIKNILTNAWGTGLVGCFMVGDITPAWYHMTGTWGDGDPDNEDFPCDLFYMDMDGTWSDGDSDGMYDSHTAGSGDLQAEIWLGRLKTDQLNGDEITMIEEYFDRNHAYRTGSLAFSHDALAYIDDDWVTGSSIKNELDDAFDNVVWEYDKATTNKSDYLSRLVDSYTAVHLMCHGNPSSHGFKIPGGGGSIWEPDGTIAGLGTIGPIDDNIMFYNLFVCSSARYTTNNYVAGWYVQSGDTLAAVGSTKTGSMLNEPAFYNPITDGDSIGDSFQQWFDVALSDDPSGDSDEWFMGMTVIGDPTLRMSGKFPITINTLGLPSGTISNVVHYVEDGVATTGDLVNGVWTGDCDYGSTVWMDTSISGSLYTTGDQASFTVVEPFTEQLQYYLEHQVDITFTGLPSAHPAAVHYVQNGDAHTQYCSVSVPFSKMCDHGSTVWVEDPVIVVADQERYAVDPGDQTSWDVYADVSASVEYYHQYSIDIEVDTVGIEDMGVSNAVTLSYVNTGIGITGPIYDGAPVHDWANAGSTVSLSVQSSGSGSNHRWRTDETTVYTVNSALNEVLLYYEQYLMQIISTGLDSSMYKGTSSFVQFGSALQGNYWDGDDWSDWCDVNTALSWDQIVAGPSCVRFHNPGDISLTVLEYDTIYVNYHTEYKITLVAEGLPDTEVSVITIGVADPSPSDDVAGGDLVDHEVTLSSPSFSWTNWVHADTQLRATDMVEIAANEKYLLICWTIDGDRYAPPSVDAEWHCLTYTAHYIGLKKEMSVAEAGLTDPVMVHITISCSSCTVSGDMLNLSDELPNEFSFVMGSATLDEAPITLIVQEIAAPTPHQCLSIELDAGDHEIWFEVRVNRAYAADREVTNMARMDIVLEELDPMTLGVEEELTIHPYIGPTLSSSIDGPSVVEIGTRTCWEFTFIVKNNFDYTMVEAMLRDYFGAELDYEPDSIMANLITDPVFTYAPGQSMQVRMNWDIGTLEQGEAFMLQVTLCTDVNPGGIQEYSSAGPHAMDSGAVLKWLDGRNKKESLSVPSIWIEVIEEF